MTDGATVRIGLKSVVLGERLGGGGEGEVFAVAQAPTQAVKLYNAKLAESRREKVEAMIAAGLSLSTSLVAYPVELVTNRRGKFLGFSMGKVTKHKQIHELYAPGARKDKFKHADYRFLVRAAANVAKAVAEVHAAGCVIGDINHSGILVSDRATVALIDADSFQLASKAGSYLCKVGTPEYTPPELQGRPFDQTLRTPDHDAFGLAVLVFQLLWMGRHPYSGRYSGGEKAIEDAIREHRFVYSTRPTGMVPPPATPSLDELPAEVASAFERAFSGAGVRPLATEWVGLLAGLEKRLKPCARSSLHHHLPGSQTCTWCKMEDALGVQLFRHALSAGTIDGEAPSLDIAALWRAIEAVQLPADLPPLPKLKNEAPTPSLGAREARDATWKRKAAGILACVTAAGWGFTNPNGWFVCLALCGFGGFLLLTRAPKKTALISKARMAADGFQKALDRWASESGEGRYFSLWNDLENGRIELTNLPRQEQEQIANYQRNRRQEQLAAFLEKFKLRSAKLRGIGPAKLTTLMSYGIEDAGDISQQKVIGVPGFGPVNTRTLVEWRDQHAARFVYDLRSNDVDRARLAAIRGGVAARRRELVQKLSGAPPALRAAVAQAVNRGNSAPAALQRAFSFRRQAEVDMEFLGEAFPPIAPAQVALQKKTGP
jgi:DNA-binding helix-hairpin-helix protein with protein kinase domain